MAKKVSNQDLEDKKATVEEVLSRWNEVLHALTGSFNREQIIRKLLVASFIADILFTMFIWFGAIHLHDISNHYQMIACNSDNQLRTADRAMWEYALKAIRPMHPHAGWYRFDNAFQRELRLTLAPKSCKL
jgi:hypothetical protein